jgi:Tfp pilus assembly protein PilF
MSRKGLGSALKEITTGNTAETHQALFHKQLAKGRRLEEAGDSTAARNVYQTLIARFPDRYQPYHRLGVVADRQGRHREAQALYTRAIRLGGAGAEVFNDLGYCFYLQGKYEYAERSLRKAVLLVPASARFRNNLGLALGRQGRYDEALKQFTRSGNKADAYHNLAYVHALDDQPDKAHEHFRKALAADPSHELARRALASLGHDEQPEPVRQVSLQLPELRL